MEKKMNATVNCEKTLLKIKHACCEAVPDLNVSAIDTQTRLREDLALNSLTMMMLAVAVEEEFDFCFDELPEFQTVGDICHYIEEHADGTANARP